MGLGSFCPHDDGEAERAPVYVAAVSSGDIPGGYAADDGAAVHYVAGRPHAFVSERDGAQVFQVMASSESGSSDILVQPEPMTRL